MNTHTLKYFEKSGEEFVERTNMQRVKVTMKVISRDDTPYTQDVN